MQNIGEQDVVSVSEFFKDLDDPRCPVNRKHLLGDVLVICICAVVSGADGPLAIGTWAESKKDWLHKVLELPYGIPSHDTIGRVLATLKPSAFQACFEKWTASLQSPPESTAGVPAPHIALDGKALRHSYDKRLGLDPLFLISAWSVTGGISLGQLAIPDKTSEITAIPALLGHLDLTGAIVTIDAAGCQKNIAQQIVDQGGDYLLALKRNQENIYQAAQEFVLQKLEQGTADELAERSEVVENKHGRQDTYQYLQFEVPRTLKDQEKWARLKTLGVAVRISEQDGKITRDVRYFLSSMPLRIKAFAQGVRGHWAIENTLHWCLDVTFREDESRLRNRIAADNIAWLKRFAIGLIKQNTHKHSVAMRRRMAGWNENFLAQLIGIPIT